MPIVHDWLDRRAPLSPERVALIDALRGDRRITLREWNAAANRTARLLHDTLGVRRGDRVAVLAMNCVEFLDVVFACAKLGAILQPLNWRLSAEELKGLFADAEPVVLIYGPDFQAQVEAVRLTPASVRHVVRWWTRPRVPARMCSSPLGTRCRPRRCRPWSWRRAIRGCSATRAAAPGCPRPPSSPTAPSPPTRPTPW